MVVMNLFQVRTIRRERIFLNSTQRKELQVARMFIPVVVLVLLSSIWVLVTFISAFVTKIFYREIWMMLTLITQVNSTANFFIYYSRGTEFRNETKSLFAKCCCSAKNLLRYRRKNNLCNNSDI